MQRMNDEILKSNDKAHDNALKAVDYDRLLDAIFEKDSIHYLSIHFRYVEKEKNTEDYFYLKNLYEKWEKGKKI